MLKSVIYTRNKSRDYSIKNIPDFGPLEITNYQSFLEVSKKKFYSDWNLKASNKEVDKQDFETVEVLKRGSIVQVALVKNNSVERHRYHAMKVIEKKVLIERNMVENIKTEKNIMRSLAHPLLTHLEYFIQDNCYLYFIMPYIPGRDLYAHLTKLGKFPEHVSRFYSAQVILAVEYLHFINFIHRDIKPENILVDHTGYVKLSDFGFCKHLKKGRTYSKCGTVEYMSPEMLLDKGYGFAADWWAVGVLIYELNAGMTPFYSKYEKIICKKIIANMYIMPVYFSQSLRNIVRNMLQENTTKRFGNLKDGVKDIKEHEWFRSINWLALLCRKIEAPSKPETNQISSAGRSDLDIQTCDFTAYKYIFDGF